MRLTDCSTDADRSLRLVPLTARGPAWGGRMRDETLEEELSSYLLGLVGLLVFLFFLGGVLRALGEQSGRAENQRQAEHQSHEFLHSNLLHG